MQPCHNAWQLLPGQVVGPRFWDSIIAGIVTWPLKPEKNVQVCGCCLEIYHIACLMPASLAAVCEVAWLRLACSLQPYEGSWNVIDDWGLRDAPLNMWTREKWCSSVQSKVICLSMLGAHGIAWRLPAYSKEWDLQKRYYSLSADHKYATQNRSTSLRMATPS